PTDVECSVASSWNGVFSENNNPDSCPAASIIHLNYPRNDGKGNIKVTWMDGGLLPQRPDELLPDEPMGNWDGGVIFEGTKGKIMADCYGANPRLLPTSLMKETLPPVTIPRATGGADGHSTNHVNPCIDGSGQGITSPPFAYPRPLA